MVIYNPTAGLRRRGRLTRTLSLLHRSGVSVLLRETAGRGHAQTLAATADGVDAVVAAGGDGTINEVANGLALLRAGRGRDLPLGIIPLGTANVLARELGLPLEPDGVAAVLARDPARTIHPGRLLSDARPPRLFVQMAGVGLDARVVANIRPHLKRLAGKGAYVLETIGQILAGPRLAYRVGLDLPDGQRRSLDVASAVIAKGHFYGGGFVLAPAADPAQPLFQVCLFHRPGSLPALAYSAGMVLGRLGRNRDYSVLPAVRVTVEPLPGGPTGEPVQGDGDVIGHLPVRIELAPTALSVLAPAAAVSAVSGHTGSGQAL